MKKKLEAEIIFGIFALALIYVIFANNANITGFVISPSSSVDLVYPPDELKTRQTDMEFMFKYPYEFDAKECTLILNTEPAGRVNALLSARDTRISAELVPGYYEWSVQCTDYSGDIISSESRSLFIGEEEDQELIIKPFRQGEGFIYEFELKPGLELELEEVLPNDMLLAKKGENSYEVYIVRIYQDYELGIENVDLLIKPGDKRIKLNQGGSTAIDFNNDGVTDLNLDLDKISYRKAYFTAWTEPETKEPAISKPTIVVAPVEKSAPEEKMPEEQAAAPVEQDAISILEAVLLIIVIILFIAVLLSLKKTRKKVNAARAKSKEAVVKKKAVKKSAKASAKKPVAKKTRTKKKASNKKSSKKSTKKKPSAKKRKKSAAKKKKSGTKKPTAKK